MIRRPPRSTRKESSAASDVYKRQIIAFTLYTKVQKYVGASLAGFTLYIFSIYSAIYGIIIFDEKLLNFHYFGAIFVFTGVYLARKIK